jgi:hypothetical protein
MRVSELLKEKAELLASILDIKKEMISRIVIY